jgi:PE family protein/PPE family protein
MSFLTALPEALQAAAAQLSGLGSTFEAQSTAIAAPTTGIAPAAADEVSALQSQLFSTYGTLYQQISAQATAIQQQIASTLGLNGGSYSNAEATNAASAAAGTAPNFWDQVVSGFQAVLGGNGTFGPSSNLANVTNIGGGNYASACSDLLGLAGGGLLDTSSQGILPDAAGLGAGLAGFDGAALDGGAAGGLGASGLGAGGLGGAPVLAGVGASSSVGQLSVPPAWAAGEGVEAAAAGSRPVTLAGWTGAAPGAAPAGTTVPAGMPAMATAGKSGGLGAPRYGVKPKVMPKPTTV